MIIVESVILISDEDKIETALLIWNLQSAYIRCDSENLLEESIIMKAESALEVPKNLIIKVITHARSRSKVNTLDDSIVWLNIKSRRY